MIVTRSLAALLISGALLSACAAAIPKRPTGAPTTDPMALKTFEEATRHCRALKTLTAEIRLSGRAADERLRGTLHAGFAAPGALRFEAVAPFGPPVFVLAGRDNRATLLFPRDDRVLPDVPLAEVLERLTALSLSADDVRLVLTGCLVDGVEGTNGRAWNDGWSAVSLGDKITAYVQERNGQTVLAAADYGPWLVDYGDHVNGWPRTVRIRSRDGTQVDAIARLDQVQGNVEIDPAAFTVAVPAGAERITLSDLRAIAPLRGTGGAKN